MFPGFLSKTLFDCIIYFESLFLEKSENIRLELVRQADNNFLLIKR